MLFRDEDQWAMDARLQGATHRIELNGKLDYTGPSFRARVNPATFEVEQAEPTGNGDAGEPLSLEACAAMYVLLRDRTSGIRGIALNKHSIFTEVLT
jgi:hypothetical protein